MTGEEAIHNISVATGEPEGIVERRAYDIYASDPLTLVNIHNFNVSIEKPNTHKPWVSPYAKFDKMRKRK